MGHIPIRAARTVTNWNSESSSKTGLVSQAGFVLTGIPGSADGTFIAILLQEKVYQRDPSTTMATKRTHLPWSLILLFVILTAAVLAAGIISYQNENKTLEQTTRDQLSSAAKLKQDQISTWLTERRGDAQMVFEDTLHSEQAAKIIFGSNSIQARQSVRTWMDSLQSKQQYSQIILLNPSGSVVLSSPEQTPQINKETANLIIQAWETNTIALSELTRDLDTDRVYLDLIVPLSVEQSGRSTQVGSMILRIDPTQTLYPLIQAPFSQRTSAESYLVRQDGQQVTYISPLVGHQGAPLTLQIPWAKGKPDSLAAQGAEGIFTGQDYLGTSVLAAARLIPGTRWALVTKFDQQEIYAELVQRQQVSLSLVSLMLLATGMGSVLIFRHREAAFFKQEYQDEISRQALNEHLLMLTRYANDVFLLMDENWRILEVNDRAQTAYGYTRDELQRMNLRDLQTEASFSEMNWQAVELRRREGIVFETMHRRKDYTSFPVECSSRIIEVNGKIFYQSVIRDITERRQAELELRENERRFRTFYEQAPIAYQLLDSEGKLVDVNRAWLHLLEYPKDQIIGERFSALLSESDRERFERSYDQFKVSGEWSGAEFEVLRASGNVALITIDGKANYDNMGNLRQAHCIIHDVTEKKLAEEKVRRMNEELERRVLERTAQLEAANRELEAFSYSVSHDLRAPLRAIDGFSRILSEEYIATLDPEAQHYLDRVRDNTRIMSNLIDNLLSFSRLSRQPLKKQSINPRLLVDQALEMLLADKDGRVIDISVENLPACMADPALLKQVYVNLLSNAIKFTGRKEHAAIEVGCLQENHETIYYVRDNGVGFNMDYANKLFGVFQRLHRSEDYEGTGVGLAIVQRIINRHGGRIWATSEPDQGATFCFTLEKASNNG